MEGIVQQSKQQETENQETSEKQEQKDVTLSTSPQAFFTNPSQQHDEHTETPTLDSPKRKH